MFTDEWGKLRGMSFDGYRLTSLVSSGNDRALFRAANASDAAFTIGFREAADRAEAETIVNRFQEAAFFQHPNLARIYDVGVLPQQSPLLVYWVTEPLSHTLAEATEAEFRGSSELQVLSRIAPPLIAGLQFLHRENFIYCALGLRSVYFSENQWKLTDFGELRIAGTHDRAETRRLLTRRDLSCPPEAYQGTVDKPWDAWSLGSLLHEVLGKLNETTMRAEANPEAEVRTGHLPLISPECNYLINELMDPEPSQRLSLEGFQDRLASMADASNLKKPSAAASKIAGESAVPRRPIPIPKGPMPPSGLAAEVEAMQREKRSQHQNRLLAGALAVFIGITAIALTFSHKPQAAKPDVAQNADAANQKNLSAPPRPRAEIKPTPFSPTATNDPRENTRQAVLALLRQWVKSTLTRNVDQQMNCYAPVLDRYYGRRNMTRDQLKQEKQKLFSQVGNVQDFTLSQVQFRTLSPQTVVIVANKTWDFPERRFSGVVQEEIVLRPINGEWKIASERDLRGGSTNDSASLRNRPDRFKLPGPVTDDPEAMIAGARP